MLLKKLAVAPHAIKLVFIILTFLLSCRPDTFHRVKFLEHDLPTPVNMITSGEYLVKVTFVNIGSGLFAANSGINMSYHWAVAPQANTNNENKVVVQEGLRTPLWRDLGSNETITLICRVKAPETAGQFILEFDAVHEMSTWFSQAGSETLKIPVTVKSES